MTKKWSKFELEMKRLRKKLHAIEVLNELDPCTIKVLNDLKDNSGVLDFKLALSKITSDDISVITRLVDELQRVRKNANSYKSQVELHKAINWRIVNIIGRDH